MIKIHDLDFSYGSFPVLDQIALHWEKGEFVSIIGENGSGKSTLLKLLCGINKTGNNHIHLWGQDINSISLKSRSRLMAYIPQRCAMDFDITVYDFTLLGRKPWFRWREGERDKNRVFEIFQRLSIEELALRKMGELSGGERQKVLIARALVQDTPIILLDEPTNNLDIRFQVELMEILKEESLKNNKLIIMAVHDINLALRFSTSVLLLKNGSIISSGPVHEALNEQAITKTLSIENEIIDYKGIKIMIPALSK